MQHHGFDYPLSLWLEGIFPLDLSWVLTHSLKTLLGESKNQGLVCTHAFHRMDSKDTDIHVLDG